MTLAPEMLKDLRTAAAFAIRSFSGLPDSADWNNGRLHPAVVLALLDRIEALETFVQSLHGEKDAAVLNQRVWRFLNPNPGPSRMSDPDPDEEGDDA